MVKIGRLASTMLLMSIWLLVGSPCVAQGPAVPPSAGEPPQRCLQLQQFLKLVGLEGEPSSFDAYKILSGSSLTLNTQHPSTPYAIAFNRQSTHMAVGGFEGDIAVWDLRTVQKIFEAKPAPQKSIKALALSSDASLLASSSKGRVLIWNLESQEQAPLELQERGKIAFLVFSEDDSLLVGAGGRILGSFRAWDLDTRQLVWRSSTSTDIMDFVLDDGGSRVYSAGIGGVAEWRIGTRDPERKTSFKYLGEAVFGGGFLQMSRWHPIVVRARDTGQIGIWSRETGQPLCRSLVDPGALDSFLPSRRLSALAVSPDGTVFATATRVVRFWDVRHARELGPLFPLDSPLRPKAQVQTLIFRPDGHALAIGYSDGTVHLWTWGK